MKKLIGLCLIAIAACVLPVQCVAQTATSSTSVVKKVLDNGLTVIVKPEPGSGLVAITALVKAGANQEGVQTAGIGNFVSQLLLAGTRMSSAEEVAAISDEVGGNISAQWTQDFTDIRVVTTSAMFNRAMSLMGESLTEANFEKKWVEQARAELLKRVNADSDDVFDTSYSTLRSLLYEDNGYRRPALGFERTARLATPEDLQKFYTGYFVPNNVVMSIVGDVTVDQAMDRASKAFAGVPSQKLPVDRGVPDETLDHSMLRATESNIPTAYLLVGWLAPGVSSPDYPAMAVAANALGGGKGSLMFRELRQKRGMGYDLGTMYPRYRYQSHVMAYVITDPFKNGLMSRSPAMALDEVKAALFEQVESLKDKPLSQTDLDRARGYTIGTYALSHQRLMDRAYELGWLEASGAGYDAYWKYSSEVEKVTASDVQRVARKYFGNCATVLLLPKTQSPTAGAGKN